MSFREHGFLSPARERMSAAVRSDLTKEFALAVDINRLAMRTVYDLNVPRDRPDWVLGALLFIRGVRAYQAALQLLEQGMCTEAQSLCRACIECVIHLGKLADDPGHVDALEREHERHRITHAEKLAAFAGTLDPEVVKRLEAVAAKQRPSDRMNIEQLAADVGLSTLYQVHFRGISGNAAHATMGALLTHWDVDSEEAELDFGPQWAMVSETLGIAVSVGLEVLNQLAMLLDRPALTDETLRLATAWGEMNMVRKRGAAASGKEEGA
jgi:hypothetical protein